MLAQKQLHGAQHRIVVEGSPLHHDMVTQGAHILQLHNLEQGVLDNRQGNTGRDIANLRPILLSLLYLGIHEHRATGAQVYRCLGLQCLGSEFPGSQLQALGKILNKGAAACRACLVQDNAADAALVNIKALHVLAANVQHKGHFRAEFLCRPKMGKGLHLAIISMKGGLDYRLSIAGGKGGSDIGVLVHGTVQLPQFPDYRLQGRALIASIRSIQKLLVPADNSQLGGS